MRYTLMGLAVILSCLAAVFAGASGFAWLLTHSRSAFYLFMGFFGFLFTGTMLHLAHMIGHTIRDTFEEGLGFRLFGWRFEVRDERKGNRYLVSRK